MGQRTMFVLGGWFERLERAWESPRHANDRQQPFGLTFAYNSLTLNLARSPLIAE